MIVNFRLPRRRGEGEPRLVSLDMDFVPQEGSTVRFGETRYLVCDVEHGFDSDEPEDDASHTIVVTLRKVTSR